MRLDKYKTRFNGAKTEFEFLSEGPKGSILKGILFSKMQVKGIKNLYNLEFGDKDRDSGEIDSHIVTDNQDRDKVLVTVAHALFAFFQKHPKANVLFAGSTAARTRLYRMAISKYYDEIALNFEIKGLLENQLEIFKRNTHYLAFIIRKK
jgi:hypothetical protein